MAVDEHNVPWSYVCRFFKLVGDRLRGLWFSFAGCFCFCFVEFLFFGCMWCSCIRPVFIGFFFGTSF